MPPTVSSTGRVIETPAPGGRAVFYVPDGPLSGLVNSIWLYEAVAPPHARERVLPSGSMQLIINLRDNELQVFDPDGSSEPKSFPGSLLCGAHSEPFLIDTVHQSSIMGVHFRPGGAFPFLGPPAAEFRNTHVSLEAVWGTAAGELRERMAEAEAPGEKLRILADALLEQATGPLIRRPAVSFALKAFRGACPPGQWRRSPSKLGLARGGSSRCSAKRWG
jgi:hypothetical protein